MAAGAGDVRLQLGVTLDLASFRQQLAAASRAAASFSYPINLSINSKTLDKELVKLQKEIRVNINDSQVIAATTRVETLAKALSSLTKEKFTIDVAVRGPSGGAAGRMDMLQEIFSKGKSGEAFGGGAVGSARAQLARQGLLARLEQKSLTSGGYNVPGLKRVVSELGGTPSGKREDLVAQAKKLVQEVDDAVIEAAFKNLKDIQAKLQPLRGAGLAPGSLFASRSAGNYQDIIGSMAGLTKNPRAAGLMLRQLPEERIRTDLFDLATRQERYYQEVPSAKSTQGMIKGFDPLLRAIADNFSSYTKTLNASNPWVGKIGDGIKNVLQTSVAEAARKALPPIGGTTSPLNNIPSVSGLFGATQGPRAAAAATGRFSMATGFGYQFPMAGMMGPAAPIGQITAQTSMFGPSGPLGPGNRPPGGFFSGFGGGGGGQVPSGGFPSDNMMGPRAQLGAGYFAAGKAISQFKTSYEGVKQYLEKNKLPLGGAIAEVGSEFGNAIKQVLLFGTAYKALAFFIDIPNQAFEAAKGLQTYENQLKAVTSASGGFEQSFAFVDGLAQRFNVPLESARQGFVKLYASMQPAGFDQQQIEGLFSGIAKAAAAFGLSSDKVDRVNYAFAQMASKGQIMSEELKGQLGDVLPGALALFARAAQMSIPEFSKAMEDGAFKGKAMMQVLGNVSILMNRDFGPAASGAAKTLQGALTQIQNNLKIMYESMAPLVDAFAAIFGPQVNSLIKDVTETMKVLTATFAKGSDGVSTLSPRALALYETIQLLSPSLQAAGAAIADLGGRFMQLAPALVQIAKLTLDFISTPLARAAIVATLAIAALNATLVALRAVGLTGALKAVYSFISGLLSIPAATGAARLGIASLKLAITGIFVGAILVGLDTLIGKLIEIGNAGDKSKKQIQGLAKQLDEIASRGDVNEAAQKYMEANTALIVARRKNDKALSDLRSARAAAAAASDPAEAAGAAFQLGQAQAEVDKTYAELIAARKNLQNAEKARLLAVKQKEQQDKQTNAKLTKIDLNEDAKVEAARDRAAENARKLADDQRKYEADLMKMGAGQAMALDDMTFSHWKDLQKAKYDLLEAGQNEWMSREIKFQRDLQAIEIRRMEAVRAVRAETQKAEIEAQSQAYIASGKAGATGLLQGSTGVSSGPHFDVRRADGTRISEAEARALFDENVKKQLRMTSGYGPRNTGIPGASTFHRGIDLAGPANTPLNLAPGYSMLSAGMEGGLGYTANIQGPQGQRYKVGHLQQPQAGAPASRVRTEQKKDINEALAMQAAVNATERESLGIKQANAAAQREINVLIKEYVASLMPVEQQKLENSLLEDRIALMSSGAFGDALDNELAINKVRRQTALGIAEAEKIIAENNTLVAKGGEEAEKAAGRIAIQKQKIEELKKALEDYLPLLREQLQLQQRQAEAELSGAIQRATPLGGLGLSAGFIGDAASRYEEAIGRGSSQQDAARFAELQNQLTLLETRNSAVRSSILAIGDAFGTAMTTGVAGLIDGTASAEEVFANFLKGVGEALMQAAQQMIATYIAIGIARIFAGLGSSTIGATGPNPGGIPSTGNVTAPSINGFDLGSIANVAANGAVWKGGFEAFANGGMVTGPTLGLIGEGKYNEAIVPLPDGRSIPVQLQDSSIRDKMGSDMAGAGASPMLSMSFQTTTINGVEYVDRAQLEAAMAETRRISVREGATRGATIALDKLANSPSSRRRVGLR
jgi:tape measure domain-containing protein